MKTVSTTTAKKEGLTEYAEKFSQAYFDKSKACKRKAKSLFFTPKQIARYMASLFRIKI